MNYVATFSRTSKTTAGLILQPTGAGYNLVATEIVSCPELLVDQRGLELSLLCGEIGANVNDVEVRGIDNPYERDWVIYQAKNWRGHLREKMAEYDRLKQEYQDSKVRI